MRAVTHLTVKRSSLQHRRSLPKLVSLLVVPGIPHLYPHGILHMEQQLLLWMTAESRSLTVAIS